MDEHGIRAGGDSIGWQEVRYLWRIFGIVHLEGGGRRCTIRCPILGRRWEMLEELSERLPEDLVSVWSVFPRASRAVGFALLMLTVNVALFSSHLEIVSCFVHGNATLSGSMYAAGLLLAVLFVLLIPEPGGLGAYVLMASIPLEILLRRSLDGCVGWAWDWQVQILRFGQFCLWALLLFAMAIHLLRILDRHRRRMSGDAAPRPVSSEWPQPLTGAIRKAQAKAVAAVVASILVYAFLLRYGGPGSRAALAISGIVLLFSLILHFKREQDDLGVRLSSHGLEGCHSGALRWAELTAITERAKTLHLAWDAKTVEFGTKVFGNKGSRLKELIERQSTTAKSGPTRQTEWRDNFHNAGFLINLGLCGLWIAVPFLVAIRGHVIGGNREVLLAIVVAWALAFAHGAVWLGRAHRYAPLTQAVSLVCFLVTFKLEVAQAEPRPAGFAWAFLWITVAGSCVMGLVLPAAAWWDRRAARRNLNDTKEA